MPPSSSSSCLIIGTRRTNIPVSRANKEAFSQLPKNSLNDVPVEDRSTIDVVNTWIQSSAGGTSPRTPFADNIDVELDENFEDVDIRIVEEVRLGDPNQPSLPAIGNREESPTRVVATPSGDPGIVQSPVQQQQQQPNLRPQVSKREAAKLRGAALLELYAIQAASSVDLRPDPTAPISGPPQQEVPAATDNHDVLQAPQPIQRLESPMEDNLQKKGTGLAHPHPRPYTSTPSFNDDHNPLISNNSPSLEKSLQTLLGRVSETDRFLAQSPMLGGLQEMGPHQDGGERGSVGGAASMLPINGNRNLYKQTSLQREPSSAQGKLQMPISQSSAHHAHPAYPTYHGGREENSHAMIGGSASMLPQGHVYMQNPMQSQPPSAQALSNKQTRAAWDPLRGKTSQYRSPYGETPAVHETSKATATSHTTQIVPLREAPKANPYEIQSFLPPREPPRGEGGPSRVHNPVLQDDVKAGGRSENGNYIPREEIGRRKGYDAAHTNLNLRQNTSTPKSASPFAVVIQSPRHMKTSSKATHHNSFAHSHNNSNPKLGSAGEAPALTTFGQHRTSSFRVEINSSPVRSLHRSPPSVISTNAMGKKRGRPFATPESAARAAEKAARRDLQSSGDGPAKKRGRPFTTVEAAEKAAKKLKSTGTDSEQPKKRGRPFAVDKLIEGPEPYFPVFYCEWKGCPAELHNLDTLRKHLHVLHKQRDKVTGMIPCMFRKCANSHTAETNAFNIEGQASHAAEGSTLPHSSPVVFRKRSDWKEHLEKEHLTPIAWHLGDGPQVETFSPEPAEYDLRKNEPWLFNSEGVQVIESVRGQKLERGRASVNNGQRYKKKLQRDLYRAKRESMLAAGKGTDSTMAQNKDKKTTGFSVVLPSKPLAVHEYSKVDIDDDEDELALDNNLGYDDVFDEDGDEMLV
ncbi:hypothetical protein HYFRA_00013047 [Hymenoscyphus fraxineus]|uniref:C2H2-type domain-containing protein n=1 Tax=Hymenoscyphus fraxineus TaxID=746836 RepID=A0A9N9L757_9HELO|nr:hypothetical protein HYFRA_00013047 [Hymenoscyphus fraxineus]